MGKGRRGGGGVERKLQKKEINIEEQEGEEGNIYRKVKDRQKKAG